MCNAHNNSNNPDESSLVMKDSRWISDRPKIPAREQDKNTHCVDAVYFTNIATMLFLLDSAAKIIPRLHFSTVEVDLASNLKRNYAHVHAVTRTA